MPKNCPHGLWMTPYRLAYGTIDDTIKEHICKDCKQQVIIGNLEELRCKHFCNLTEKWIPNGYWISIG